MLGIGGGIGRLKPMVSMNADNLAANANMFKQSNGTQMMGSFGATQSPIQAIRNQVVSPGLNLMA